MKSQWSGSGGYTELADKEYEPKVNSNDLGIVRFKKFANPQRAHRGFDETQAGENSIDSSGLNAVLKKTSAELVRTSDSLAQTNDDLLASNDISEPLQGKSNRLTDHFIGADEKQPLVNPDNNNHNVNFVNAKHVGSLKEKPDYAVGSFSHDDGALRRAVKDYVRIKGIRKIAGGRNHNFDEKITGKGKRKILKIPKIESPRGKMRKQGKSKNVATKNSVSLETMCRNNNLYIVLLKNSL